MKAQFPTGKVEVEVTQHWIERAMVAMNGRLSRECNCPVAHAVAAAGFEHPKVSACTFTAGDATGFLHSKGTRRRYVLPFEAQRFIEHFDDNHGPAPITFEVDADDYVEVFHE